MIHTHLAALIIGAASFMFINMLMGTLGAHLWQDRLLAHNGVTNFGCTLLLSWLLVIWCATKLHSKP